MSQSELIEPLPTLLGPHWRSGGQARLWVDPSDSRFLIKVFYDEQRNQPMPRSGRDAAALVRMLTASAELAPSEWHELVTATSWPVSIYGRSETHVDGIRIPMASSEFFIDITTTFETPDDSLRPCDIGYLTTGYLQQPVVVSHSRPHVTLTDRVEIVYSAGRALSALWRMGFLFGDMSSRNLLWSLGDRPRAFLIDIESCRLPGEPGPRTSDWEPLQQLGSTIEGERGLFARLAYRVFAHSRADALPDRNVVVPEIASLPLPLQEAIFTCHELGSARSFDRLMAELRALRSHQHESTWFDWAVDSGFARLVLEHAPKTPTPHQSSVLNTARRQAAKDAHLVATRQSATGIVSETGFEFDIPPTYAPISRIDSRATLRSLFENGEFQNVARLFAQGGVHDPHDKTLTRAVEHAVAEIGAPRARIDKGRVASEVILRWNWPAADWVNALVVTVVGDDGAPSLDRVVRRQASPPHCRISSLSPAGAQVFASFAVQSPDGTSVTPPRWTQPTWKGTVAAYATPAPPPSTRQVISLGGASGHLQPTDIWNPNRRRIDHGPPESAAVDETTDTAIRGVGNPVVMTQRVPVWQKILGFITRRRHRHY